jgi:hypothetical protein
VISSSSELASDYDLAGDEIVSCGPDYIRLHAHHWANASHSIVGLSNFYVVRECSAKFAPHSIFPYDFRDTIHARVRVLEAEANIAVSVQITQYAARLIFFIVLLQHALNHVVHIFSKKYRKHLTILGSS